VLEGAGAIERVVDGRTHRLRLAEALADAEAWVVRQRRLSDRKFEVREDYLREGRR
jgi:hypothetical protein